MGPFSGSKMPKQPRRGGILGKARRMGLAVQALGLGWLCFRLRYACLTRSGWFKRRTPAVAWEDVELSHILKPGLATSTEGWLALRKQRAARIDALDTSLGDWFAQWDGEAEADAVRPLDEVTALRKGRLLFYEGQFFETGFPPAWHRNAVTGETSPVDPHWSQLHEFGFGDVKNIWEPGRFRAAYLLPRAWVRGVEDAPELFWGLLEDFAEKNPPNRGLQWKCGQEVALRLMGCLFAGAVFRGERATTPERELLLARFACLSASRIEANLEYALSQKNNHGMSECVGLIATALAYPEFADSEGWYRKGMARLLDQVRELVYEDGAFSQNSTSYHRVMVDLLCWTVWAHRDAGRTVPEALLGALSRAGRFLGQLTHAETGRAPVFGGNDGAHVLPLSTGSYLDFRSAVQAALWLSEGKRAYDAGPWDEALLWLDGKAAISAAPTSEVLFPEAWLAKAGGYAGWRGKGWSVVLRAGEFRHRPPHADLLHVEAHWRGWPFAVDPGSFSYNAPKPFDHAFTRAQFHNTVTRDGADQMERVSRFLYAPWPKGGVALDRYAGEGRLFWREAWHGGYLRSADPCVHRRAVVMVDGLHLFVIDALDGREPHDLTLHWHLAGLCEADAAGLGGVRGRVAGEDLHFACGASGAEQTRVETMRADREGRGGWWSPHYQKREPLLTVRLHARAAQGRLWSVFSPKLWRVTVEESLLRAETEGTVVEFFLVEPAPGRAAFNQKGVVPVLRTIKLSDRLGETTASF